MPRGGKREGSGRAKACQVKVLTVSLHCSDCGGEIDSFANEAEGVTTHARDLEIGSTHECPYCKNKYRIPVIHKDSWGIGGEL